MSERETLLRLADALENIGRLLADINCRLERLEHPPATYHPVSAAGSSITVGN